MPVKCLYMEEPSEYPAQSLPGGGVGRDIIFPRSLGAGRGEAGVLSTGVEGVEA